MEIRTILTDTGSQFTDRFTTKSRVPSGKHLFDLACEEFSADRFASGFGGLWAQSGQQHPKADNGGQRPAYAKTVNDKASSEKGVTKEALGAGEAGDAGGKKNAKK